MNNMVETTAERSLVLKIAFAICAFILAIVLMPAGTAHAAATPTLAAGEDWYTSPTDKSNYTTINIVDSYAPTGSEKESWDVSAAKDGSVTAYVSVDGATLTIAGNGSGYVKANQDSNRLFEGFSSVTAINGLSLLDMSDVYNLGGLFLDDVSLASVKGIEGWNVGKCQIFTATFSGCESLTSIDLSKWDMGSATTMASFFKNCTNLADLKTPTVKAVNAVDIGFAFQGCKSLVSLDVSFMSNGKIQRADAVFDDCWKLRDLTGYERLVNSTTEEASYIFNSCQDLQYLDVSQWDVSGSPYLAGIFAYTYDLKTIDGLENWDLSGTEGIQRLFLSSGVTNLDGVSGWDVSNVAFFQETFCMTKATSLDLSAWETASAENMNSMFELSIRLEELKFGPGFTTANVADFKEMLKDLNSLKVLDVSMFDTRSASSMTDMLAGMNVLQQVTLGEGFSFTGNGSAACVLPTPDPAYIPGATGNWQAVAGGTADDPKGAVYAPAEVPSNVAETYVMEVSKAIKPVLAANNSWYTSSIDKSTFTTISIVDSYAPTGSEKESWDASDDQDGSVMAYVSADGKTLIIAGNGYGCIGTTWDCKKAFSSFSSVTAVNGIDLLDMSDAWYLDDMFYNCESLVSLDLDSWDVSDVLSFRYTFDNCYALTSLGENDLKDWDTGSVTSFFGTFSDCHSLKAVDVSGWDLSACYNLDDMFGFCKSLTEIDVSEWDVSNVTHLKCTFDNCVSLKSIDVSKWDTSAAKSMNGLFNNCKLLTTIDVSGFDTSSCVSIGLMFAGCETLKSIDVTGFDTQKVEDFQGVFDGCKSLTSIDVSTWDTSAGADMSYLFDGCIGLTELSLGAFDTSACTDTSFMFNGCNSLAEINGLSNWDTSNVASMTWMFRNCANIEVLDLSAFDTSSCTQMTDMFAGMNVLQQIALGEEFSFAGSGSTRLTNLPTPSTTYFPGATGNWQAVAAGTVEIPKGAVYAPDAVPNNVAETYVIDYPKIPVLASSSSWYYGHIEKSNIAAINIVDSYTPDGTELKSWDASAEQNGSVTAYLSADGTVVTIAGNGYGLIYANANSNEAFAYFDNLVVIEGAEVLDTSNVTNLNYGFCDNPKLVSVDLDSWDVSNVTQMCNLFQWCESLESLGENGLRDWDTSKVELMGAVFENCKSLAFVDVSGWDVSATDDLGYMFAGCAKLAAIDVSNWDVSSVTGLMRVFRGCAALEELDLSSWKTGEIYNMAEMFSGCTNLKKLDLSGFDSSNAKWLEGAFDGMVRLQQVTLGEKFSFTGNGNSSCVLPTPDPAYITGAIGKWQSVAGGTVAKPAGTIYLPEDVPSKVAETYVMPLTTISVDVPVKVVLAASSDGTWCTPSAAANQIVNHSMAPVKVASAKAGASDGFSMLAAANVASSTTANVFGGTITAGADAAQDLTAISTSGDAWTMAAETDADDSDLISLQLAGSIGNVEGKYFTSGLKLFDITYTFELAL